ncbi:MAG: tetratricopeptide repeat protein [Gammaproteobacteria bacterium]|nr:MAG: tetratricopeptide repeat protein [Gammaproteobacteria bacterium]
MEERTYSFSFKGRDAKIADIGRDLNVATVLEGSVRTAGDRVRINAQLIDVAHGFELWSDSYDRELTDILQVQDEIAGAVARALQVTLLGEKTARREVSPEAYNAYLQGKYFANRLGEETLNSAITHYERALSIEHEWAEAWVGLAMALQWGARFDHIPVVEGFAQARFAVEQALRHDPDLAAAHAALGWIRWSWDFDFAGAGAAYRRALQLEPGNLDAINGSAHLARCLGDYDEAVALSRRAVELDPLNPNIHMYLAEHLLLMGRYAEAISAIQQTLRLNPDQVAGHWGHCWILLELDRPEEALVAIEKEVAPFFRLYGRILAQLELGRREEADAGLQQMIEEHAEYGALNIAFVYARRGEPDLAFEWLELAYEQRDTGLPYIKSILEKDLGSDPRWKPYLKKIGFPDSG